MYQTYLEYFENKNFNFLIFHLLKNSIILFICLLLHFYLDIVMLQRNQVCYNLLDLTSFKSAIKLISHKLIQLTWMWYDLSLKILLKDAFKSNTTQSYIFMLYKGYKQMTPYLLLSLIIFLVHDIILLKKYKAIV